METPGELRYTLMGDGRIRIDHADRRIRLSGAIVRTGPLYGPHLRPESFEVTAERLVIGGIDQRVVYRIGEYHAEGDYYDAEWPD